jgi:hypothetical protein
MNYNTWNKILCDYFFSQSDTLAFLSIDKEELVDLAIQSEVFQNQLKLCGKLSYSIEECKQYAWKDFIHIFGNRVDSGLSYSKKILFANFQKKIQESANKYNTPSVFPYITLFVIPLSNDPELNANAFYPKINDFLHHEFIIKKYENIMTQDMAGLNPGLDFMWKNLSEWAAANEFLFTVVSRSTIDRAKYASPFLSQLIFTAAQRDNFKLLFYYAGLTPSQEVTEENAIKIMSNYYSKLGLTKKRWDVLRRDYISSALLIFFQELTSWDGIAIVQRRTASYQQSEYLGVSQNLLLEISNYRGLYQYGLKANLKDATFGEEFFYGSCTWDKYNFTTDNNGLAEDYIWNEQIKQSISKGENVVFYKLGDKNTKLSYIPLDIELLEYSFGKYISSKKLQPGRKYLAFIKKEKQDYYNQWLKENDAKEIPNHLLTQSHSLYAISSAISELTFNDIKRLKFETRKSIELIDTLSLGKTDDNAILVYKGLPIYFRISGVNVTNDSIRAVFNSEGRINSLNLTYDEESDVWELVKVANIFMQQKQFQIYCNSKPISPTHYKVTDFTSLQPNEYNEIKFNNFGEFDENGAFKGLVLKIRNGINWETLHSSMIREGESIPKIISEYTNTDYLLYFLSSQPRCEKCDFIKAIDVLIQNKIFKFDKDKKWAVRSVIDNYFRLGYINYAYIDGKHVLAVNRPTLLLLPPKTKRVNLPHTKIIRIKHTECFWTALLSGARTPKSMNSFVKVARSFSYNKEKLSIKIEPSTDELLPQTVYIRANSIDTITKFAEQYNISFQKCIYSNTLLNAIADVSEYIIHITQKESFDRYDGITNFVRIDYTKLANEGIYHKSNEFSKDSAIVTYFPGTFREQTIFWKDGNQYLTDKHWGHLIGMALDKAQIIKVKPDSNVLELPIMLQLPQLYARALTLVSGKIPNEGDGTRTYGIYDNPYVGAADSNSILKKLSQKY